MLNINIVCVGKVKESFYREASAEYLKRLSRFAKVVVSEAEDCPGDSDLQRVKSAEAKAILPKLKGFVIALDIEGKTFDSLEFARILPDACIKGGGTATFVIGGSHGLDDSVLARADMRLSFGAMTFPHQLMRVILLEQIYRSCMINSNSSYHK